MAFPFLPLLSLLPTILKLVAPSAAGIITGISKDLSDGKISEAEAMSRMVTAIAGAEQEIAARQSEVVIAESKGEDWLQRNWRPIVALTSFFSYWYVIVAFPHLVAWQWISAEIRFGEIGLQNMFWLTATCVGGYIGGRSLEKIAATVAEKLRR